MTTPAASATAAIDGTWSKFWKAVVGAVEHLSWRIVGATLAIAAALDVWFAFDAAFRSREARFVGELLLSTTVVTLVVACCVMFATRVADQWVGDSARRFPAYAAAVAIGAAAGALAQWLALQWLGLRTVDEIEGYSREAVAMQPVWVFLEFLTWGAMIVFVYVNRRSALRAASRLNSARMHRAETRRRTLESRLQALQARVEPQFLFDSLARVRDMYESDPPMGNQVLGDLIAYLRAALPHLRESASTLRTELDLAIAYLNVMRRHRHDELPVAIDVSDAASAARVPAMVVLPLINHALIDPENPAFAADSIRIAASVGAGRLRLEIGCSSCRQRGNEPLRIVEQRIQALYGEGGTIAFVPLSGGSTHVTMEIPYEPADGHHR